MFPFLASEGLFEAIRPGSFPPLSDYVTVVTLLRGFSSRMRRDDVFCWDIFFGDSGRDNNVRWDVSTDSKSARAEISPDVHKSYKSRRLNKTRSVTRLEEGAATLVTEEEGKGGFCIRDVISTADKAEDVLWRYQTVLRGKSQKEMKNPSSTIEE